MTLTISADVVEPLSNDPSESERKWMKDWHKVPKHVQERVLKTPGLTVGEFMQRYRQPNWCDYPEALASAMGCWSLMGGLIRKRADCFKCDLRKGTDSKCKA